MPPSPLSAARCAKYLKFHNELPMHSLAAMAPINVRSDKDTAGGNIVASMTVQIRSDMWQDPLERLQAVHESSGRAKELTNAIGAKAMTDYTQFIPSMLTAQAARLASRWGLANRMNPSFNCVITNVPGPPIPALQHRGKNGRELWHRARSRWSRPVPCDRKLLWPVHHQRNQLSRDDARSRLLSAVFTRQFR